MLASQLQRFAQRGQAQLQQLQPCMIKLGGIDYPAATAGVRHAKTLELGGMLDDYDIRFRLAKTDHPNMPEVGVRVLWVEKNLWFRVLRVSSGAPHDAGWHLGCQALTS
jgi:hypothetical protein